MGLQVGQQVEVWMVAYETVFQVWAAEVQQQRSWTGEARSVIVTSLLVLPSQIWTTAKSWFFGTILFLDGGGWRGWGAFDIVFLLTSFLSEDWIWFFELLKRFWVWFLGNCSFQSLHCLSIMKTSFCENWRFFPRFPFLEGLASWSLVYETYISGNHISVLYMFF